MKARFFIATAWLAAAPLAHAQSNVTVYGKLDVGVRKAVGSSVKEVATSGDSRLGFRGVEDLGGGLKAFFGMEHRFFPDTGTQDGAQFWKGYSHVGLQGDFGRIGAGRQYTAAFSLVQNQIDPFGGDTVAQLRDGVMRVGGITKVRVDGSLRYDISFGGLSLAASVAEGDKNGGVEKATSVAASWRSGAFFVAGGIEDPAGARDTMSSLGVGYTVAGHKLTAGYSSGKTNAGLKAKGWMLGLDLPIGAGIVKAAYGQAETNGRTVINKLGVGYHHSLSKRTMLYANAGHDSKAARAKTGYDLGILHSF